MQPQQQQQQTPPWGGSHHPGPPQHSHQRLPHPHTGQPQSTWPPHGQSSGHLGASGQDFLPQKHPWEARYREMREVTSRRQRRKERSESEDDESDEIDHERDEDESKRIETSFELPVSHRSLEKVEAQNHDDEDEEEEEEKPSLDLETRIAMLLQNKDANIAAPFLSLADESDEEGLKRDGEEDLEGDTKKPEIPVTESDIKADDSDKEKKVSDKSSDSDVTTDSEEIGSLKGSGSEKDDDTLPEEPLSTPPSPFISKSQYLFWHEKGLELRNEAQRKERAENRERLKRLKKKRLKKTKENLQETCQNLIQEMSIKEEGKESQQVNGNDDCMSLSSLSSTEDPILHQDVLIPPPPPPPFSSVPSGYPQPYSQPNYPYGQGYPPHIQQNPAYSWQPPLQGYQPNVQQSYSGYNPSYMSFPPGASGQPGSIDAQNQGQMAMYQWPMYPASDGPTSDGHLRGLYHDPTVK